MDEKEAVAARVGTTFAQRYEIVAVLGVGGMGVVYEARDTHTSERLALKVLAGADHDVETVRRFLREARAAARVTHPNVVKVIDSGVDDTRGTPYIAHELLVGRDLAAHIAEHGALGANASIAILVPVMEGLMAAHAQGIVHRDIKPQNIFLATGDDGAVRPTLIDFGVAKLASSGPQESVLTRTGAVLGTPAYMSPEQVRGQRDVDEQTDVWALGVVLYEMLAGGRPFERETPHATIAAILVDAIEPLAARVPDVPDGLVRIVERALERNRVDRYQSVREFHDALVAWRDGETPSNAARPPHRARPTRIRWRSALAIVAVSAIVLNAAWYWRMHAATAHNVAARSRTRARAPYRLVVHPPEATIELDGRLVGHGTWTTNSIVDLRRHVLRVAADGYAPQLISFREEPPPMDVTLTALPPPPLAPVPPAPDFVQTVAAAREPAHVARRRESDAGVHSQHEAGEVNGAPVLGL